MDLEEQIGRINNPQEFVKICNTIFVEKYKEDFQVTDGTRGDEGIDGYITSEQRIIAIYCPVKPESRTDKDYREKIYGDLEKAKKLNDLGRVKIKGWTFVTPRKLSSNVIIDLKNKAEEFGLEANHLEATFLAGEFYKNIHLLNKFSYLSFPRIEEKLDKIGKDLEALKQPHTEKLSVPIREKVYREETEEKKQSDDLKMIFGIINQEQAETSKQELRSVFYKTQDKIAQVNAILGLIKWYDPFQDRDEDMVHWCDEGIRLAEALKSRWLWAVFLSNKGMYLSQIWAKKDMETAYSIQMGNTIGFNIISEEHRQKIITELYAIQKQFSDVFKEALDIGIELKNASLLAQICLNIGQASGGRYIHLNALKVGRADYEKALSKRSLLWAKELYAAIGDELGVAYALHNLANQLDQFGEKEEARALTKTVIDIAKKYKDSSLLQTASWLEENLRTGQVPDYVHGERRERKK